MLELRNVTKTFGNSKALDDLSMTVPRGAVYGLVGPNGAGKSTAIRNITGVYRPDQGRITMEGIDIYENPGLKSRMGYIPDDIFYYPSASLEEMRKFYKGMYPNFDDAAEDSVYMCVRIADNEILDIDGNSIEEHVCNCFDAYFERNIIETD